MEKEKYLLRRRRKTEKEKEKSTRRREIRGSTSWYLVVLGQYGAVLVGTLCYWVSIEWCLLIYDGAVSVDGGTGWYLMVLGQ